MNVSKKAAVLLTGLGLVAGTAGTIAMQTHAQSDTTTAAITAGQSGKRQFTPPAADGTIGTVNGSTFTVVDQKSGITFTVEAGSATIEKIPDQSTMTQGMRPTPTTVTVADLKSGDTVRVEGSVSGSVITATHIMDGKMMGRGFGGGHGLRGNGGTVTAINGNTLTITGKNGTSYTVEAGSSTVSKITTGSLSDIKVGDEIMVHGSTSGTTITATNIVDGMMPHQAVPTTATAQ